MSAHSSPFGKEGRASLAEYWLAFKTPLLAILSALGWYVGIVSAFDFGGDFNFQLLVAGIVVGIVLIVVFAVISYEQTRKSSVSQSVKLEKKTEVIIHSEGYIEALKQTCNRMVAADKSLDGLVCVCGVSRKGTLDYVSEGSALEAVLELTAERELGADAKHRGFLKSKTFEQMNAEAHERVAEILAESSSASGLVAFGQCVVIDLPYTGDANDGRAVGCPKLLLVANSNMVGPAQGVQAAIEGTSTLVGPASVDVIPSIFVELENHRVSTLIMPALGTYRLGNSYQTVISEIVSRYLSSLLRSKESYDLVLSLHKRDLQRSKVGLMQIRRYVRNAIALFSQ